MLEPQEIRFTYDDISDDSEVPTVNARKSLEINEKNLKKDLPNETK